MKSFSQWKLQEAQNPVWENLKSTQLPMNDSVRQLVLPKLERVQEELVRRLAGQKIQSYRDVPPHLRDMYAQTIVSCVLELFYPNQTAPTDMAVPKLKKPDEPIALPQDQFVTPAASKG